jgi:endonuclease/exonuclease/phosphatase (EEP) superfamily protein YafD
MSQSSILSSPRQLLLKLVMLCLGLDVLFSIVGCFGVYHQYGELASHFRLQYLVIACGCLVIFAFLKAWGWAAAALVCASANAMVVLPWVSLHTFNRPPVTSRGFRLISSNVYLKNRNHKALIDFVREENPDALFIQEANDHWLAALKALDSSYPYSRAAPKSDRESLILLSRYKLEDIPFEYNHAVNFAQVLTSLSYRGKRISLVGIHPSTPVGDEGFEGRNHQFAVLADIARNLPQPTVVIGDFNSSMWSPYFSRFVQESGLVSARKGFGVLPTWPTFLPPLMIPIDQCLVSSQIEVVSCRTGKYIGSDHLPLIVDLTVRE